MEKGRILKNKLKKYSVGVREVHVRTIETKADSKELAIQNVKDREQSCEDIILEYSHELDAQYWTVEEVTNEN